MDDRHWRWARRRMSWHSRGNGGLSAPTLRNWPASTTHDRRSNEHEP
jgi:hypothetical protein